MFNILHYIASIYKRMSTFSYEHSGGVGRAQLLLIPWQCNVWSITMPNRRKPHCIFHINMLREWYSPTALSCWAEEIFEEDSDGMEVPTYSDSDTTTSTHPRTDEGLSDGRIMDITSLWETFSPGRTSVTEHSITTGQAQPIRLPPYRAPHAYRDTVREELKEMEPEGIIERSASEWAAPILMVKKKDGSLRMCVDVSQAYAYPMPRIDDLIDRLGETKFITTLDLSCGYCSARGSAEDCFHYSSESCQSVSNVHRQPFSV